MFRCHRLCRVACPRLQPLLDPPPLPQLMYMSFLSTSHIPLLPSVNRLKNPNQALLCCCSYLRYNHSGLFALRFEADYSGLIHVNSADCYIDQEVMEDKVIEVPVETNSTEADGEAAKDAKGASGAADKAEDSAEDKAKEKKGSRWSWKKDKGEKEEGDAEPAAAAGDAENATNKTEPPVKKTVFKTIQVPKKKTFQVWF